MVISNVSCVKKETFVSGLAEMIGAEFLKCARPNEHGFYFILVWYLLC